MTDNTKDAQGTETNAPKSDLTPSSGVKTSSPTATPQTPRAEASAHDQAAPALPATPNPSTANDPATHDTVTSSGTDADTQPTELTKASSEASRDEPTAIAATPVATPPAAEVAVKPRAVDTVTTPQQHQLQTGGDVAVKPRVADTATRAATPDTTTLEAEPVAAPDIKRATATAPDIQPDIQEVVHEPATNTSEVVGIMPIAEETTPGSVGTAADPMETLEDLLIELAAVARRAGMRSLASEVSNDRLQALREGRITAIVLGEFNHGKSTLLNALLGGREVLPTGITPTTAQITHLRYAERPEATIQYDANDRIVVPIDELPELVGKDQEIEPQHIEVGYPAPLLKNNLVLVDTPGVNDISKQRVEITYGYLPRADVIIYVLDANQVLKQSEITFIQNRLLRSNRDRLLFVLGKIDTLSADEQEEVELYAREKLAELIGDVELYPLSARKALEAPGSDPGFERFRDNLVSYLQDRRAFILIDSGVGGGLRIAGMLRQNLAIKRRGYALDRNELNRRVAAVRARIGDARKAITDNLTLIDETTKGLTLTAQHNIKTFTEKFTAALPLEIERATTEDIKKYLPDWIRDTYKAWIEEEGNNIARALEALAQEVIETTNRNLGEAVDAVQDELGLKPQEVDLEIDTMPYDVGVFAVGAIGATVAAFGGLFAGGMLLLAAPVLAFMFKDKTEAKLREKALEQGRQAIEECGRRVEAEMIRVIDEHGEQLKIFVESAGDRLYRQVNEALEQVVRDTSAQDADRKALDDRARLAEEEVAQLVNALRQVRASLLP